VRAIGSVNVAADDATEVDVVAGSKDAAIAAAAGAALGGVLVEKTTEAFIGAQVTVNARNNVEVRADAAEDLLLVAAGNPITGSVALAGSFPVVSLNTQTHAFIDEGANVRAEGNAGVSASDRTDTDLIGGAATLGLGSGFGTSAAMTLIDKDTKAWIGQAAHVEALALRGGTLSGYGDEVTATGPEVESFQGVGVKAFSSEDVFSAVASGAAQAGFAGIAGPSSSACSTPTQKRSSMRTPASTRMTPAQPRCRPSTSRRSTTRRYSAWRST
jgi:hypothetical protein